MLFALISENELNQAVYTFLQATIISSFLTTSYTFKLTQNKPSLVSLPQPQKIL